MIFTECSSLTESEKLEILELWNHEYPEKLSYQSKEEFDHYLHDLTEQFHILLLDKNKRIKGWYFDFNRNGEKWFTLILNSEVYGKGIGTKILNKAKEKSTELNGWVVDHNKDKKKNGDVYKSPINFYMKSGFKKCSKNRLESDKISAVKIQWIKE